jgi:pimeloyl-ACP methyl ester carboxylesterase
MPKLAPSDHLVWHTIEVNGRRVQYGVAGHGLPVLFVHGWALGSHAYKRALKRVVRMGCQVFAPSLPEFGGTAGLPDHGCTLAAYAAWVDSFLAAVGVDEPVLAIGHSLGGAVVTQLAHDFPDRVGHLVLINAVGTGTWPRTGDNVWRLAERSLWTWASFFPRDLVMARGTVPAISAILEDAFPNLVTNPIGLWKTAMLARRVDLTVELARIKTQGVPVSVVWSEGDSIIPKASFEAMCAAVGVIGHLVPGRHSWLLADPGSFARVVGGPVAAAKAGRRARAGLAGPKWRRAAVGPLEPADLPRAATA